MEELEREIQQIATRFFPPRTEQDLAIVAGAGGLAAASLSRMPIVHGAISVSSVSDPITIDGAGPLLRRFRTWSARDRDGGGRRTRAAARRGGAGRDLQARQQGRGPPGGDRIAATRARDAAGDRTARATSGAAADRHDADSDEAGRGAGRREDRDRRGRRQRRQRQQDRRRASRRRATNGAARSGRAAGASAADNRKQLEEAERLLRAERFTGGARDLSRLAKSRRDRGPALVGLAEISFQEKHYEDAVKSATRAADRGGGVRARVLLGDAHFRLNQFKEAAKAYEGALKLDPKNASARSGLALANKRM